MRKGGRASKGGLNAVLCVILRGRSSSQGVGTRKDLTQALRTEAGQGGREGKGWGGGVRRGGLIMVGGEGWGEEK